MGRSPMRSRRRGVRLSGMTSLSLVEQPGRGARLQPVTVRDRLRAWWRAGGLDQALAAGVAPEADVALTLHARRLIAPRTRRRLARTLYGIAVSTLPVRPAGAGAAAADLLALAQRLERPGAVDARGVALVRLLLADAGGPLHSRHSRDRLPGAALAAAAALDPA
jgi:hypothetical protein